MRRWLVLLYPGAWRRRFGAEFAALLEQQPLTPAAVFDVARGALDAHRVARRERRAHAVQRRPEQGKEHTVKRGRHRYSCSFCGKSKDAVQRLIAGPGVYICDECIALCNEILAEERTPPSLSARHQGRSGRRRRIPWWWRLLGRQHRALQQTSAAIGR